MFSVNTHPGSLASDEWLWLNHTALLPVGGCRDLSCISGTITDLSKLHFISPQTPFVFWLHSHSSPSAGAGPALWYPAWHPAHAAQYPDGMARVGALGADSSPQQGLSPCLNPPADICPLAGEKSACEQPTEGRLEPWRDSSSPHGGGGNAPHQARGRFSFIQIISSYRLSIFGNLWISPSFLSRGGPGPLRANGSFAIYISGAEMLLQRPGSSHGTDFRPIQRSQSRSLSLYTLEHAIKLNQCPPPHA